ncbi:hypothetical protein [Enterococcus gallinarum]|nr:hypothetical protein [Enterococcus gallinarum]OJG48868.1 hypothetical protein RV03_GL000553 [Enterococcus gallinarum]
MTKGLKKAGEAIVSGQMANNSGTEGPLKEELTHAGKRTKKEPS